MARRKREGYRITKTAPKRLRIPLKYLVISGRDEMKVSRSVSGILEDISMNGLIFKTPSVTVDDMHISYDESPLVRNRLTLEIDLPGRRKVTALGEVSWYERSLVSKEKVFHVGVTFTEMSEEDRQILKDYLVASKKSVEAIALDS